MAAPLVKKVLIIGSGPITIGQTGAFDDAASCACDVYRQSGIQTVMVHCDPSATAADSTAADQTYMIPLTYDAVMEVILREKPDAVLPTVGGPNAIGLVKSLSRDNFFKDNDICLLGISEKALSITDAPFTFYETVQNLGLTAPQGQSADRVIDAAAIAETIGYPVFARAVEPMGALKYGIAYNVEELRTIIAGGRLPFDAPGFFRIEKALSGYREIEVDVLRDAKNRMQLSCMAENIEPVGIHSGDSIAVIPPVSLNDTVRNKIEDAAFRLAEHADVTGSFHVKFAVDVKSNEILVLSIDPYFSRMTGFCSKASGISLATVHAKLSLGATLTDALSDHMPSLYGLIPQDVVAVRLPRWEFERFPGEDAILGTRMKSTGAVMGLGENFYQALQKAVGIRSSRHPIMGRQKDLVPLSVDSLMRRLVSPSPDWLHVIHEALKKGAGLEDVAKITGIEIQWVRQLAGLADLERELESAASGSLSADLIKKAASAGFSTAALSLLLDTPENTVSRRLAESGVTYRSRPVHDVDPSPVRFNTYVNGNSQCDPMGKTILIVGPGPGRIGQNIEMDHCCIGGARAVHSAGRHVALVNGNPGSACGITKVDRTYAEPLTRFDITAVCKAENPEGVILQFGGYRAMEMAEDLSDAGFSVLGTDYEQVSLTQNRIRFNDLLKELGIPHAEIGMANSREKAMDLAESIGYPLVARPQSANRWQQRSIIMEQRMMEKYLKNKTISPDRPILLEQFMEFAIEVEADALCDGRSIYVPAVMEHIELAGVHSGDAAMVVPPYSTPPRHVETITTYIRKIALKMGVKGLLNTRFAMLNDTVYLLEARPWACRTLPMISKICNIPMAEKAAEIMLGVPLEEMALPRLLLPHYGIRSSVFPFNIFTGTDPFLGLRMRSTGQAMVLSQVFGMAYYSSQKAAGPELPISGDVLITVTDEDKPSILEPARLFSEMGFGICATRGTHTFLKKNGIDAKLVKKIGFGRPDLVDSIKTGDVALVVNTPSSRQSHQDDSHIRNTAIRYGIPNITTPAGALASAKGIAACKKGQDALVTLQSYVRAVR